MKKSPTYYFGTLLILLSLSIFVYIFYPLVGAYFFQPTEASIGTKGFVLSIPKIKATGKVIEDVDPWNKDIYEPMLKEGIGHAKGFSTPDEKGTVFLFAHSTGMPWEITHYNTVFLRLNELKISDEIIIWYEGEKYTYKVTETKEVYPYEIDAVKKSKADLILQTCTPLGTDWKRLLIYAKKS